MVKMRFLIYLASAALFAAGCDSGHGDDSLFVSMRSPHAPVSQCVQCHTSANSPTLDPLVTNGSGTYGKHIAHVQERGILCERCHDGYLGAPTHMNGTFDTNDPLVSIVSISIWGPPGTWTPGTSRCSGVACHGSSTLDWYGTNTWSLPACTTCHVSGFSSALDPAATNGTPPAGRHGRHVTSRGIACERCHYQYPTRLTHVNGTLDTSDPAANLVQFNIVGTSGSWTGDGGAQTGQCASISCHGTDTLAWYGSSTWSLPPLCTTCHAASYSSALDPLLTNGSGMSGKHGKHVTSFNFACATCHLNYPSLTSHASGVLDTQDPSVLLVWFDALNPLGAWVSDTGAETGACSSLFCHDTVTPAWYVLAGVTPANCVICHGNAVASRRQVLGANGDFGANPNILSHHVSRGPGNDPTSDQCLVCHEMSQHAGGTVRLRHADTGSAIAYSAAAPGTLEPFCLSCHDASGALATAASGGTPISPFNDGAVMGQAPNRASVEIADQWSRSYGHKQQGLTCIGNGTPNTGCHGNGHGSTFAGILARRLALPNPNGSQYLPADEGDYDLCFTCHANYPRVTKEAILGAKQGGNYDIAGTPYSIPAILTLFRDRNYVSTQTRTYEDPTYFSGPYENLHFYHLQIGPDAWNYRDSISSSVVCLTCHSVHGSNTQWGWVHDAMLFSHVTGSGTEQYGMIGAALNSLGNYPTSCAFNCHPFFGTTHSWFDPSNE